MDFLYAIGSIDFKIVIWIFTRLRDKQKNYKKMFSSCQKIEDAL